MKINMLVYGYNLTLHVIFKYMINNDLYFSLTICYDNCNYRNI